MLSIHPISTSARFGAPSLPFGTTPGALSEGITNSDGVWTEKKAGSAPADPAAPFPRRARFEQDC